MLEVTAADIYALSDQDLRTLVGLLCEADVREHGIPTSSVTWGGNQNAPDGGIDVRVAVNKDGLLAVGFAGAGEAFVVLMSPDAKFHLAMKPQEPSPRVASLLMKAGFSASSAHARSPASLYSRYCTNCHENGNYGAPKRQSAEWNRFPRDVAALLPIAKSGIGAMIPKGGCSDCTDEELKNLIKFMLPSWNE